MNWFLLKAYSTQSVLSYRDKVRDMGAQVYVPTTKVVANKRKGAQAEERPLMFSYIFVHTDAAIVTDIEQKYYPKLIAIWKYPKATTSPKDMLTPARKHLLVIPDRQMSMFMQTVGQYNGDVPFLEPSAEMLEKGDRVRIIDGAFKGVEGTLVSQRGKDGGRVLVRISDLIAVPTLEIEPKFIEVLEFAKGSHHLYQKMNSLTPRVEKAIELKLNNQPIPFELTDSISVFIKRFSNLTVPTNNQQARYLSLLLQCYLVLDQFESANAVKEKIEKLRPKLNSESMTALTAQALNIYGQLAT